MRYEFYCRESKASKKTGKASIQVAISVNGERKFYNLPLQYIPSEFKRLTESRRSNELKDYLDNYRRNMELMVMEMAKHGIALTHNNIREYLSTGGVKSYRCSDMFEEYISLRRKDLQAGALTRAAFRKFELTRDVFYKYTDIKPDDEVTRITNNTVLNFYAEIRKIYKSASAASTMRRLKAFINYAMDNDRLKINPFVNFKATIEKKKVMYLTEREIQALMDIRDELNDSLRNVLNFFILQISTGLAYSDLAALRKEDIQRLDGCGDIHYFINKRRVKSGVEYFSLVLPLGEKVLEEAFLCNKNVINSKEKEDVYVVDNQGFRKMRDFRVLSNQKLNLFLHQIEALLKCQSINQLGGFTWSKTLHSHLGRHTYAYLLLNKYKIRAESAARAMGHTNSKTTLKFYADITNNTIIEEMKQAQEKK